MTATELLNRYIFLHNYGIEMGDFEPLMSLFHDDAVFEFEDSRIGTFSGIDMIKGVFRRQAPTLTITVRDVIEKPGIAVADYGSDAEPDKRLGSISLEAEDDKIKRLFIGK